jgi:hypothetical protein
MANAADAPIGTGMAKKAAGTIALKKEYDKHVIDAASNGEDPMKYEDWVAKRMEDQKAGYKEAQ